MVGVLFFTLSFIIGVVSAGTCTASGTTGACTSPSSCSSAGGVAHSGICSGSDTCCTDIICGGGRGLCMPSTSCTAGTVATGLCPGPSGFTCCKNIRCDSNKGTCLSTGLCSGMTVITGKCPGPAGFACCEDLDTPATGKYDRTSFYAAYASAFGTLSASQKAGINDILTAAESDPGLTDYRWLAYMLATVKWECAGTYLPIEEYGKGAGRSYGNPVTSTDSLDGRGYVQLTWKANYENIGNLIGEPRLLCEPELALNPSIAYKIMSTGMRRGTFTGVSLSRYINADTCDYTNARRIINGLDQASTIAGYASSFQKILESSKV